jgi:N-acetylglutamate synthase-like GNAT family acetyltransferase
MSGSHSLQIRPAEPRDAAALTGLTRELGYEATEEQILRRLRELSGSSHDAVFVADAGDECTGWIHVCVLRLLESESFSEIRGLVVTERLRGTGVGAALIGHAERWARERGSPKIRVRTNRKRLRTHEFYAKRGYEEAKEQKVFEKLLES